MVESDRAECLMSPSGLYMYTCIHMYLLPKAIRIINAHFDTLKYSKLEGVVHNRDGVQFGISSHNTFFLPPITYSNQDLKHYKTFIQVTRIVTPSRFIMVITCHQTSLILRNM